MRNERNDKAGAVRGERVSVLGASIYAEVSGRPSAGAAPVLLLHGGFGTAESFGVLAQELAQDREVHAFERPGHGRSPDVEGPYSYERSLDETVAYLDARGLSSVDVVGYSDGGILGIMLAQRFPSRVNALVAISANLNPQGFAEAESAAAAGAVLLPERESRREPGVEATSFEQDLERYKRLSPDGPEHADVVLEKLVTMWRAEPTIDPASLATVTARTLVMAADRDSIRVDHSLLIAASIPDAELCIVPGTSHGLLAERPALTTALILDFLA